MTREQTPLLRVRALEKQFEGITVLKDVNFDLYPGETSILFGENGAGKSTFVKIICGGIRPNGGEIFVNGEKVTIKDPSHARSLGIVAVQQDFGLIPQMTVIENLYLGREYSKRFFLNKKAMIKESKEYIESLNLDFEIGLNETISQ